MFNALFLRNRTAEFVVAAILLGIAMFCLGMNSAYAQYNDYGYGNSYSNDYGYSNSYDYNDFSYDNGYRSSSSSSSSDSEDDGNSFWWYVLGIVVFILFGTPGVAVANAVSKGKLDQKTHGMASGIVNNPMNRYNAGIVGNAIINQANNIHRNNRNR